MPNSRISPTRVGIRSLTTRRSSGSIAGTSSTLAHDIQTLRSRPRPSSLPATALAHPEFSNRRRPLLLRLEQPDLRLRFCAQRPGQRLRSELHPRSRLSHQRSRSVPGWHHPTPPPGAHAPPISPKPLSSINSSSSCPSSKVSVPPSIDGTVSKSISPSKTKASF